MYVSIYRFVLNTRYKWPSACYNTYFIVGWFLSGRRGSPLLIGIKSEIDGVADDIDVMFTSPYLPQPQAKGDERTLSLFAWTIIPPLFVILVTELLSHNYIS